MTEVVAARKAAVEAPARRSLGHLSEWISLAILAAFLVLAALPSQIAPFDPIAQDIPARLQDPSAVHPFGTDELGRDILSRIIHGVRVSLGTAIIAVLVSLVLGVPVGLTSGYIGGRLDEVLSRATDILLAFPGILVAMTIIAVTGRKPVMVAVAIGIVNAPAFVRITRAVAMQIRGLPYVDAVRSAGASNLYIMFATLLPNCISTIYVQALLVSSRAIIIEAGLSFLGLGIPPPAPSWGGMLNQSRSYLHQMPWYGVFPGVFIVALVLSLQMLSKSIQKALGVRT